MPNPINWENVVSSLSVELAQNAVIKKLYTIREDTLSSQVESFVRTI